MNITSHVLDRIVIDLAEWQANTDFADHNNYVKVEEIITELCLIMKEQNSFESAYLDGFQTTKE